MKSSGGSARPCFKWDRKLTHTRLRVLHIIREGHSHMEAPQRLSHPEPRRRVDPADGDGGLIPTRIDQNPSAHERRPMERMRQGWSMRSFQAAQQWATMSAYPVKTRFESQLSRMNCQTFS